MPPTYKPAGYPTVSPYLVVAGAADTIDFLERVFGATLLRRIDDREGNVRHAEVRLDDSVLMVADGNDGWPPADAHVHVFVEDVDATWRRALEAGATPIQEPVKKEDEDKRGGVQDAGGTTWWISTRVG